MKVHVVYCHPDPESFAAVVRQRAVDALRAAGHEVRVADLHAEAFDPTMSSEEVRDHLGPPEHKPSVAGYCADLQWCEALVFIYPTWWSGQPAMLTGWLDRVLIRGIAWDLPDGTSRITPKLANVRRLVGVTTYGSGRFINFLEGETGRRVIGRALRVLCRRTARTSWLALYNLDRSTAEQRQTFLQRVERHMSRL